ncbi:MAG: hypothetical protein ACR2OZ_04120 [Verrucomicrobiales bacterium]
MADDQNIHELRTELEASRWDMYSGVQDVTHQLNVPSRVRRSLRQEPWKWLVGIAVVGVVAGRALPFLLRHSPKGWISRTAVRMLRQSAVTALPVALHYATEALQRRQQARHLDLEG